MTQRRICKKLLFISISFVFLAFCFVAAQAAEEKPTFTVQVAPRKVTLGDEIHFVIKIKRPVNLKLINPPSEKTSLNPFEIKSVVMAATKTEDGQIEDNYTFTLTIFQLGDFNVPPISLVFADQSGHGGIQGSTQPVKIQVVPSAEHPKSGDDIRPIKGPVSMDTSFIRILIVAVIIALLCAAGLIIFILSKQKKRLEDLESILPAHERARLELGRLREKNWIKAGKVKEFYSELADILRRYVQRGFGIDTYDKTTFEIMYSLKEEEINGQAREKIKIIFENSDLVKFAKFTPPGSLADDLVTELGLVLDITAPKPDEEKPKSGGTKK